MPRKGMRALRFDTQATLLCPMSRYASPTRLSVSTPTQVSFNELRIDQSIEAAEALISKWSPESSSYSKITSLFFHSRPEALQFLKCVNKLQKSMHSLVSENPSSDRLVYAQNLMQIGMKRLQREFYMILSMNRAHLDPESVSIRSSRTSTRSSVSEYVLDDGSTTDDDIRAAVDSVSEVEQVSSAVMGDLRAIAECMISAGYAKECITIYKIIRKSIIDEGIYRLRVEKLSPSQVNKMDWEVMELKIRHWLEAVKIATTSLFNGERILCDEVFASSDSIRESCFADVSREGACILFGFSDLVAKSKSSRPEKIFRLLDMCTALSEHWSEIESIFSFDSTFETRSVAASALVRLGESVRTMLSDFEHSIQKYSSKSLPNGGGIHSLTMETMNYLALLADYSNVLADIFADWTQPSKLSLPESYLDSLSSDDSQAPAISLRVAWLILVLLCKLDGSAKHYKNVAVSYFFLANNIQYVVSKVCASNLKYLLGVGWVSKHEEKVRQFTGKYEVLEWGPVYMSLPANPRAVLTPSEARAVFRNFNLNLEEAYRKLKSRAIPDQKLRVEIKEGIWRKVGPKYREFYNTHRITVGNARDTSLYVKYSPKDVVKCLEGLFSEETKSESLTISSSASSFSSHRRKLRHHYPLNSP